ncbi:MAG: hypothetical protein JRI68_36170 [Deltaproteobacteria bacterium]|nr:hypothetical protein [Deltaproteobacteria bacterium]
MVEPHHAGAELTADIHLGDPSLHQEGAGQVKGKHALSDEQIVVHHHPAKRRVGIDLDGGPGQQRPERHPWGEAKVQPPAGLHRAVELVPHDGADEGVDLDEPQRGDPPVHVEHHGKLLLGGGGVGIGQRREGQEGHSLATSMHVGLRYADGGLQESKQWLGL